MVGAVVSGATLYGRPTPTDGDWLFLAVVERVLASGYALPETIPHYTAEGLPFRSPPLAYYVGAVLLDWTPLTPRTLGRYAPVVFGVLIPVPYYLLGRELLGTHRKAGVATVLLAATPPALSWHVSTGSLVRPMALLFALWGAFAALRLFRGAAIRWLPPAAVLFGLTVLTHAGYAAFLASTVLLFYVAFDGSTRGGLAGAGVLVGGVTVAAPWWVALLHVHGPAAVLSGAVLPDTLADGPLAFVRFALSPFDGPLPPVLVVLSAAATFYCLGNRRWLLPAWLVTAAVTGGQRLALVAGSMMTAAVLSAAMRSFERWRSGLRTARGLSNASVAGLVVVAAVVGVVSAGGAVPLAGAPGGDGLSDPDSLPPDENAVSWVATNTNASATFVVVGGAVEWFPLLTNRTVLVGPWRSRGGGTDEGATTQYRRLANCGNATCLTAAFDDAGISPDYLYVPGVAVGGSAGERTGRLFETLNASTRYRLVYRNGSDAVYRVALDASGSRDSSDSASTVERRPTPTAR